MTLLQEKRNGSIRPVGEISIRRAEVSDLDFILGELRHFSDFFGSKIKLWDDANIPYLETLLSNVIKEHLFLVSTQGGKATGFIAGFITAHVLNPNIQTCAELFWWVAPESRGTRAGALLLREYIRAACEDHRVDWITMTLESNSPVAPESLLKRGFRHQESSYIMEVG